MFDNGPAKHDFASHRIVLAFKSPEPSIQYPVVCRRMPRIPSPPICWRHGGFMMGEYLSRHEGEEGCTAERIFPGGEGRLLLLRCQEAQGALLEGGRPAAVRSPLHCQHDAVRGQASPGHRFQIRRLPPVRRTQVNNHCSHAMQCHAMCVHGNSARSGMLDPTFACHPA
jgi:hypothetical protein